MSLSPEVSIVLSVFNGERYLAAAIQSILSQTYTNFELIALNDGSTDATRDILNQYSGDPRVRAIHLPHVGLVGALNTGLELAEAPLIARLDADDVMMPNRLERQVAYLKGRPHLGGCASYYRIIDEEGVVRGSKEPPLCTIEDLDYYISAGGRLIYPAPTMMFRRDLALALGGYRKEFDKVEDVDLFLRMVEGGHPILIQPEYLTHFRYHANSVTARSTRQQYHLNEIIFGNYRRRTSNSPEVGVPQYFAALEQQSPLRRVWTEVQIQSSTFMRHHDMALLRGRKIAGLLYLVGAAVLNPRATAGKVRRFAHFWRRAIPRSA